MTKMFFLCLILQGINHTAADHTSFSVSQAPVETSISRGGNITFYCIFPIFPSQSWVRVLWWKHGENEFLHSNPDKRKMVGMENKVSGFIRLINVTFQDSGIYHCTVICQGVGQRNGTGSHLIVHAAPILLNLISRASEGNLSAALTLVCETAAFYPENFTLTWYKNGAETTLGIHTSKVQNREGLYEVSSSFVETQPVPSDANYTRLVSHVSLETPAVVTYVRSKSSQDYAGMSLYYSCFRYVVGVLAFALLLIIIRAHCQIPIKNGKV